MLRSVDKALELTGWFVALGLVIMLFAGPQVVAEDEPEKQGGEAAGAAPYASSQGASGPATDGEALFTERCGSCHTLSAAGTSGSVGPNLDETTLDADTVESIVRDGRGSMPAFGGELSDAQIAAVAELVSGD